MCKKSLRVGIRKNFFTRRGVNHWNRPPRELPSLKVFKRCVDAVLRDMVLWWDSIDQMGGWA